MRRKSIDGGSDKEITQKIELRGDEKTQTDLEPSQSRKMPALIQRVLWLCAICLAVVLAWHLFVGKYGEQMLDSIGELGSWFVPKGMR